MHERHAQSNAAKHVCPVLTTVDVSPLLAMRVECAAMLARFTAGEAVTEAEYQVLQMQHAEASRSVTRPLLAFAGDIEASVGRRGAIGVYDGLGELASLISGFGPLSVAADEASADVIAQRCTMTLLEGLRASGASSDELRVTLDDCVEDLTVEAHDDLARWIRSLER